MYFQRYLTTTLSILTFILAIHASPVPLETRNPRPAVPSVNDFKTQHLNVQKDKTLFYSGVGGKVVNAHAKANNLHTLNDSWKDKKFQDQYMNHAGDAHKFFNHASEALAHSASGKVHVMLPHDAPNSGKPDSTWAKHEWPHLQRQGVEVHRVNVKDGKVVGTEKIHGRSLYDWLAERMCTEESCLDGLD